MCTPLGRPSPTASAREGPELLTSKNKTRPLSRPHSCVAGPKSYWLGWHSQVLYLECENIG